MTAKELIDLLQSVHPDTEVKIATETGVWSIADVRTLGYSGGKIEIVTED
jgi:hypothetical protein